MSPVKVDHDSAPETCGDTHPKGADVRLGRDVPDSLANKVLGGLKLAPTERIELIVRLNGKHPAADCLAITNARVAALDSTAEPLSWIRRQALADDIQAWKLARKFRSRLILTTGYGRTEIFGANLSVFDDDLVDEQLTVLTRQRPDPQVSAAVKTLRAQAHWVSSAHGRAVYVLDREQVPPATADAIDLDLVERQLSLLDYWPSSEVHRHLAACLPMGGCHLAGAVPTAGERSAANPAHEHVSAVLRALVTVDPITMTKPAAREADVLSRLMSVVAQIRATPAWSSPRLEDGLRLDLDDEVRHLALRCHRIAQLRAEIGPRPGELSETGRRAAAVYSSSWASLDTIVARLDERVDRLEAYRDRLRVLSRELDDLDDATRVAGVAEKIAHLAAETGADDGLLDTGPELDGHAVLPHPRQAIDATPDALEALRDEVERFTQHERVSLS